MALTKLENLVDPEVVADIVTVGVPNALRFSALADVNKDLVGRPGSTLKFPKYEYIGKAEDVAEGEAIPMTTMTSTESAVEVKKAAKGVELSDEAVLAGVGDPIGKASEQLIASLADKIDEDLLTAASETVQTSPSVNSVETLQTALDILGDDSDLPVAIILNHKDAGALRIDAGKNYIQGSALGADRLSTGVYGDVLGVQIIRSKKVPVGGFFLIQKGALALVTKRDVEVESDRDITTKTTVITADSHYAAYLYDATKVVKSSVAPEGAE